MYINMEYIVHGTNNQIDSKLVLKFQTSLQSKFKVYY